ncbi:putative malate dehydrogenase, partial [Dendrothele bispora CBS 962.96]
MLFKLLLPFALFASSLAAPTSCDISSAVVDVPSGGALPPPTHKVSFVALGVGTQNYTCSDAGTYTSVGAFAELFDISCLYRTQCFSNITSDAFEVWNAAPPSVTASRVPQFLDSLRQFHNPTVLGEHYFVVNPVTGSGLSPKWDFTSRAFAGNADAFVVGSKISSMASPTSPSNIDWLYLTKAVGSLADEVYRTDTQGGQPPASCAPGSNPITVKYTSMYWLTG